MKARTVDTATLDPETLGEALVFIAENLRVEDQDELLASVGDVPAIQVLTDSVVNSVRSWLALDRTGLPMGVMGVTPLSADVGFAWMLGTPGLIDEGVAVARHTPAIIAAMHEHFPALWTNLDARNETSLGWLLRAGFQIADADPAYGPESRLFYQLVRT